MNDIEKNQLQKILESQERMERWLVGDEKGGQFGLISRTNNHATRIGRIERAGVYIAGAGGLATVMWALWSQWPRK